MSKKPVSMTKDERRAAALSIALKLGKKCGAKRVSLAAVAAAMKVTPPLLFHIFGSHAEFVKALVKAARTAGVVLPEAAPTVKELRAKARKKPVAVKKLAPPKAGTVKVNGKSIKPPKGIPAPIAAVRKRSIKEVKAIKEKLAAAPVKKAMTVKAKPGEDLRKLSATQLIERAGRKALTPAQKAAKAARDKARRAVVAPTTPAAKFAALPAPFEAALQQVAA